MNLKKSIFVLLSPVILVFGCKEGEPQNNEIGITAEIPTTKPDTKSLESIHEQNVASSFISWRTDCENGHAEIIITENVDSCFIVVMSNNLYITAFVKKTDQSHYSFILKNPKQLGAGGIRLKWNNFSKDSSIATLTVNKETADLKWLGFYDDETKERVFMESEFNLETLSNPSKVIKCKNINTTS